MSNETLITNVVLDFHRNIFRVFLLLLVGLRQLTKEFVIAQSLVDDLRENRVPGSPQVEKCPRLLFLDLSQVAHKIFFKEPLLNVSLKRILRCVQSCNDFFKLS